MENFTKIENNVLEALIRSNLTSAELKVALFMLRKINGFHKDSDQISFSQLIEGTGLSRQTIANCLSQLKLVNIIILVKMGNSKKASNEWKINKDIASWQLVKRKRLVKFPTTTSQISGIELVNTTRHTKENTKENIQKKLSKDRKQSKPKGTKPSSKKETYGNTDINTCISYLQEKLGTSLDGSVKENRQYCYNLLRKMKKDSPNTSEVDQVKMLIDVALQDKFHSRNTTGFKYLFYNTQKIAQSTRVGSGKNFEMEKREDYGW